MCRRPAYLALLALALGTAACSRRDAPVGGVGAEEAAQLNNAAEMLDASADDLSAPAENAAGNLN